jgi:N-acetylglucosaminyldiphosphoundecaprenol N-acetyl-beta-D-mannosaminyltransferase
MVSRRAGPFRKILGVRFYISDLEGLLDLFPAGPDRGPLGPGDGEAGGRRGAPQALEGADLAVTDSGFMVLLWLLRTGERVRRISGLRLLRGLLLRGGPGEGGVILGHALEGRLGANLAWLRGPGIRGLATMPYVAPMYPLAGPDLRRPAPRAIAARRPGLVFIGLSGGVQERLGWDLSASGLDTGRPSCASAGPSPFSRASRQDPVWADRICARLAVPLHRRPPLLFGQKLRGCSAWPLIWRHGSESVGNP